MRFKLILTIWCVVLSFGYVFSQQAPKILVISLDGMNSDVWESAYTPNLDLLISNATYTYNGLTLGPTYNSTTWSSMLTGVWPDKHKVQGETFADNDFATYPHFFDHIEAQGIKTASLTRESSLASDVPSSIGHKVSFSSDDAVVAEASDYIKLNGDVGAFFVQLDAALQKGIEVGFDARRAGYLKAIQYYDEQVGTILSAVASRSGYNNENWMIVVTTNHGGLPDGTIGGDSRLETTPFIIFSGDFVRNRQFLLDILTAEKGKDNAIFLRPGYTEYIKVAKKGTELDNLSDFTIEMRVKPKDASSDPCLISDKDWGSGGNPGYVLARRGAGWKFNIANQNRSRRDVNATSISIEDDLWHHIAVSFDKDGDAVLYTDGVEVGRGNMGYEDSDTFTSPYDQLSMGQDGTLTYGGGTNLWKGVYDEVRIYNKALDSLTLVTWRDEKNIEGRHPNWDNIVAYWKMDEHEGIKVNDHSGNDYHGEIVGTKRVPANGAITHVDIAPTLLAHMGIAIDADWNLDGSIVDLIIPNIVLGADQLGFDTKDISIYPNPASDRLNFHLNDDIRPGEQVTISVFNMHGEKIQLETLTTGFSDLSLDVSRHKKGYYLYRVQGKTFSYRGKFIINN